MNISELTRLQVNSFMLKSNFNRNTAGYMDLKNILCVFLEDYKLIKTFRPISVKTLKEQVNPTKNYQTFVKNLQKTMQPEYPGMSLKEALLITQEKLLNELPPEQLYSSVLKQIEEDDEF